MTKAMSAIYTDYAVQAEFHTQVADCYRAAAAKYEVGVRLKLAGHVIELRFASAALQALLLPALAHLRLASDAQESPEFVLCLWDRVNSGHAPPRPSFEPNCYTDRGDIWGFDNSVYQFAFLYGELSVNFYARDTRVGYYWVDDPANLPYWSVASPLRTLFHWCMEAAGKQLLHGAAVGTEDGAVLLTGPGGVGKSSTSLSALHAGMLFAGDDYVVVGLEPVPTVYPLYATAKLHFDQLPIFPNFQSQLTSPAQPEGEKAVFQLYPDFAANMPSSMPLRAILVPQFEAAEATTVSDDLTLAEAKHAASFTSIEQLAYAGYLTYCFVDQLCRRLPYFRLCLGRERSRIVSDLLRWLQAPETDFAPRPVPLAREATPVTVVIPAYNRAHLIDEVLHNVWSQNCANVEVMVVDDGSSDDTVARVRQYPHVRVFEQPNQGPAVARNRGIVNAREGYIALLDSDDLWPEGMLARLIQVLDDHPEVDVVRGWPQLSQRQEDGAYQFVGNPRDGFEHYLTGTVFRTQAFLKVGLLDPEMRFGEDSDWFHRAREKGLKVLRLDCVSVIIRRQHDNMTSGKSLVELNMLRVFKKRLDRMRQET